MTEETLRGQRKFAERPAPIETRGGSVAVGIGGSERGWTGLQSRESRERRGLRSWTPSRSWLLGWDTLFRRFRWIIGLTLPITPRGEEIEAAGRW